MSRTSPPVRPSFPGPSERMNTLPDELHEPRREHINESGTGWPILSPGRVSDSYGFLCSFFPAPPSCQPRTWSVYQCPCAKPPFPPPTPGAVCVPVCPCKAPFTPPPPGEAAYSLLPAAWCRGHGGGFTPEIQVVTGEFSIGRSNLRTQSLQTHTSSATPL